jgi:hypothetical protein
VEFPITHHVVDADRVVTFTSADKTATLTVKKLHIVQLSLDPNQVQGGSGMPVTGTVTLQAPVRQALTLTLTSESPSVVSVPATITIPAGQSSATFGVAHAKVTAYRPVGIVAAKAGTSDRAILYVLP